MSAPRRLNDGGPLKKWKAPRATAPDAPRTDTHALANAGVTPVEAAKRLRAKEAQGQTFADAQAVARVRNPKARYGAEEK